MLVGGLLDADRPAAVLAVFPAPWSTGGFLAGGLADTCGAAAGCLEGILLGRVLSGFPAAGGRTEPVPVRGAGFVTAEGARGRRLGTLLPGGLLAALGLLIAASLAGKVLFTGLSG